MRYQHKDTAPVLAYLRDMPCTIEALRWDNERRRSIFGFSGRAPAQLKPEPARHATLSEVEYLGGRGRDASHASLVVRFYFHINRAAGLGSLTLEEAVAHVEDGGETSEFLLTGHPNGGLISVSKFSLPFQNDLEPITWWGP
jgi:hypothetical protein